MKTVAPDYYNDFRCIAGRCRHTCCEGWEIDIDEESVPRFLAEPEIARHISSDGTVHIELLEGERCPFLREDGLCKMIINYGEDMLCGICRDHPRFRNYWSDRVELGLGLVCEEAGRLILSQKRPLKLIILSDDGAGGEIPEDEEWLEAYRARLLSEIVLEGPEARLMEYLIYRHIPDALYDGLVEERTAFIQSAFEEITAEWKKTDGSLESLIECARRFSYDVEYDDEELKKRIGG